MVLSDAFLAKMEHQRNALLAVNDVVHHNVGPTWTLPSIPRLIWVVTRP